MKAIRESVGKEAKNNADDLSIIVELLRKRRQDPYYQKKMFATDIPETTDANVVEKLTKAIIDFQKNIQELKSPDGQVSPNGTTIYYLGGVRKNGKQIIVDLDDQNLYAFEGSKIKFKLHTTSGDEKHPTATKPQLFHIFRKHEKYVSKTYGARMDYAMFFTYDGKAIHQSNAVSLTSYLKTLGFNYFGSHGCARLSEDDARNLFKWTPMGTPVFIDMA
ncbi:MAG: L,D-transpeptidase family protein [Gammaproteobacteria bacterium]|nr:L,D-transpeptidase family protein [Gammaproteobacteria bacterium]